MVRERDTCLQVFFSKRLLDMEVPYQIITDSLGHVNKDSDKYYYSLDSEKLKSCCLDARWIGIKSWM